MDALQVTIEKHRELWVGLKRLAIRLLWREVGPASAPHPVAVRRSVASGLVHLRAKDPGIFALLLASELRSGRASLLDEHPVERAPGVPAARAWHERYWDQKAYAVRVLVESTPARWKEWPEARIDRP